MTRRTWSTTEISAYLDGRLASQDRVTFEAQIKQDPALQQRVEEMRNVVAMVRSTPLRQPPRNYLLTPSMVADSKPSPERRRVPLLMMRMATSLVALAFAVTFGLNLFQRGMTPSMAVRRSSETQEVATLQHEVAPQPQLAPSATDTDTTQEPPAALEAPAPQRLPATPAPEGTEPLPTVSALAAAPPQADTSATDDTGENAETGAAGAGIGGGGEAEAPQAPEVPAAATPEPTEEVRAFSAATIEKSEPTSNTLQAPEDQTVSGAAAPVGATQAPVVSVPAPSQETAELRQPSTLPWVTVGLGLATVALAVVTIWLSRRHVG